MLWGVCGSRRRNKTRPAGPNSGWGLGAEEEAWLQRPWAVVGHGRGAGGRWWGLAGLRDDAPSHTPAHPAPPVWRAPEGPEGTGGLRGAATNEVRSPSLAGGWALRRPEHPWGHKKGQHSQLHSNTPKSHMRNMRAS